MLAKRPRLKRTKIVATLGPSTDNLPVLQAMIAQGMDVVRLNFSHGKLQDHIQRVQQVRKCAATMGKAIGIIADLQGPKIRIAGFKASKVMLVAGTEFILDAELAPYDGDITKVGLDYKGLPNDVKTQDQLLLDDGRLVLRVKAIQGSKISCEVVVGGELSNSKGINRQGGGLAVAALTDKDRADLKAAVDLEVDYIAVSFPRSTDDIVTARHLITAANGQAGVIAKIERADALPMIDSIIQASDGVMVARGDLGVEIGDAELPAIQKHIIQRARALDKVVITATQMMESMIHNATPTRAEVSDVANAVLDGTDAVMLSAETATGDHPALVVATVTRICLGAEKQPSMRTSGHRIECTFHRADEAIAMATMYIANHYAITAIIALTESGATPLWMSRIRSGIPIYGLTARRQIEQKLTLYRGVYPVYFDHILQEKTYIEQQAIACLKTQGSVQSGDHVLITYGEQMGISGGTNTLKILQVD